MPIASREATPQSDEMLGQARTRARVADLICVFFLCAILVAGLWPFGRPPNQVTWQPDQNALRFGRHATVIGDHPRAASSANNGMCSLELWVRPALSNASSTLFAFYGASGDAEFSLNQSITDLRLDNGPSGARVSAKMYVEDVFRAGKLVFVTVVFGPRGTAIYLNGNLVQQTKQFQPSRTTCSESFLIGNSPNDNHTWQGELFGLAIYLDELKSEQVRLSHHWWKKRGHPPEHGKQPDSLFVFDQKAGRIIHDRAARGMNLSIPERYFVLKPRLLMSPWTAFEPTLGYLQDLFINVAGFVPFGFTLAALLSASRKWSNRIRLTTTILSGLLLSLTIEVSQFFLPTRDSDFTDVLTNTLGTALGMALLERCPAWLKSVVHRALSRIGAG